MRIQLWRQIIITSMISGVLGYTPMTVFAADQTSLTVKVTIMLSPPCTINGNNPIEVDFGEILTTQVDGVSNRRKIEYSLDCPSGQLLKNALKMQIQGSTIALNNATPALAVPGKANFGIQLQQETTPLSLNTWINFTYPNIPTLYAVPVKQAGSTLVTGEFTASSTMKVDYQ